MRINKFLAQYTKLSRRASDKVISDGRVRINGKVAGLGNEVSESDQVSLDNINVGKDLKITTIMLNKPVGYVCSRNGQGSKTIYDLLPENLHHLNSIGRLDKDSSGLLLLTNDGQLAQRLSHPSNKKVKIYELVLDKQLTQDDLAKVQTGIKLEDGLSKLSIKELNASKYEVKMHEGRNRQIRRTFTALGYEVIQLHRVKLGSYGLKNLSSGKYSSTV